MIPRIGTRVPIVETAIFALSLVVLIAATIFEQQQAPKPATLDSYSSYDADRGGYRAFFELLERAGFRVERFEQRPAFLDASIKTLVYSEPLPFDPRAGTSTENDARDLEAWVRAGGTFVYFGYDDSAAKAKILAQPFSRSAAKKHGRPILAGVLSAAGAVRLGAAGSLERWKLPRKSGIRRLYDDGRGAVSIVYPFGKGTVVETIDETFLDNAHLGEGDRARFAVDLLTIVGKAPLGSTIWFDETTHGYLVPLQWWQIVPRPFLYASAVAVLAVLIAIFGAALRLGPPVLPAPRDDRTSADFIDALSTLLERGKASREALAAAVHSTTRAVARSVGLSGDPSDAEIEARIVDEEERTAFETMRACAREPDPDPKTFVRGIALAQRLRKDSVSHGR